MKSYCALGKGIEYVRFLGSSTTNKKTRFHEKVLEHQTARFKLNFFLMETVDSRHSPRSFSKEQFLLLLFFSSFVYSE